MRIHVFRSPQFLYAFTEDSSGEILPADTGPWRHLKDMELQPTDKRIGIDSIQAIEAIETEGYFIVPAGVGEMSG